MTELKAGGPEHQEFRSLLRARLKETGCDIATPLSFSWTILQAAQEALGTDPWKKIDTLEPEHGDRILLWVPIAGRIVSTWHVVDGEGYWAGLRSNIAPRATHWMYDIPPPRGELMF